MTKSQAFGRWLRNLRQSRNMTQQALADALSISVSTVSRWESGNRLPDVTMLNSLARCLKTDTLRLLDAMDSADAKLSVIMVEDDPVILNGALRVLRSVLSDARTVGFSKSAEAAAYAQSNRVDVAFLDIELGRDSGLELAEQLKDLYPRVNIIYLTSHTDYMKRAWENSASGYILKPLTEERVRHEMEVLRYTVRGAE